MSKLLCQRDATLNEIEKSKAEVKKATEGIPFNKEAHQKYAALAGMVDMSNDKVRAMFIDKIKEVAKEENAKKERKKGGRGGGGGRSSSKESKKRRLPKGGEKKEEKELGTFISHVGDLLQSASVTCHNTTT